MKLMMIMMSARKYFVRLSAALTLALTLTGAATYSSASFSAADGAADIAGSVIPRPLPPEVVEEKISAWQRAESVGTVFMLGLILGMVSGVGLFFLYLRRQQARHSRHAPSDYLFEDWPNRPARGLREGSFGSGSNSGQLPPPSTGAGDQQGDGSDEMIEQPEPWERSVDWWKGDPEE